MQGLMKYILLVLLTVFSFSCDNFNRDLFSSEQNDDVPDMNDEPVIPDENTMPDETQLPDETNDPDQIIETPDTFVRPDENETPDESANVVYEVTSSCRWCGRCAIACSVNAISNVGGKAVIDPEKCTGCGDCVSRCPRGAIRKKE